MNITCAIPLLIDSLADLNGTRWDLPKRAISKGSKIYIVTGRWNGGNQYPQNQQDLVKGNPVDIITSYIINDNYFSRNRYGDETNNVYANRRLILASDFANNKQEGNFMRNVKFIYQNGVMVPEDTIIKPKEINLEYLEFEPLNELKTKNGFEKQAREHLVDDKKIKSLVNHLF